MKKVILTVLCLVVGLTSFAQGWLNVGNTLQQKVIGIDTNIRFNKGAVVNPYVYLYTKPQVNSITTTITNTQNTRIDSVKNNLLPTGLQGQQLKVKTENTNTYAPYEPLVYGQFIYTDDQLTRALANGQATQEQIFNSFKRYSHGTTPVNPQTPVASNNIPGNPSQTNSWSYDTGLNRVLSTFNTGSTIGFFSRDKFDRYVHTATVGSTANDNDLIGIVIAFVEDPNDMVTNYAYGLNPADFNWPIDVTSPLIPNQHSLTLYRNRNGATSSYGIFYDKGKLGERRVLDGSALSGLFNTTDSWNGVTVDVGVNRMGDSILVQTSNYSDAPGGKGSLRFNLLLKLNTGDVDLAKFRGKQYYGYSAQSQANAYFANISFSGSNNIIYDLRQGNTYTFTGTGYVLDPTKNLYTDLGYRFYWRNTTEHTFGYILPSGTYDVIVGETP